MDTELSKKDKKIIREIIARGLNEELKRGLLEFEAILQEWKSTSGDNEEFYHKIYKSVHDFDKQIAWRYDDMRGSKYLLILIGKLRNQLIDPVGT
jgi:hypothetical protein